MRKIFFCLYLFLSTSLYAYELVIIQAVSSSDKTFLTRTGKSQGIFRGKKATFTSENASIIATAITVSRDQTQWRIDNDVTGVPFTKGAIVTYYDATEYLWALSPESVKRKYIKNRIHENKTSLELAVALNQTLSESVSGVESELSQRGGYQFELGLEREFSESFTIAFLARYARELINANAASLTNQRFMGIVEPRYYFEPIRSFSNARIFLGLGFGYGRSQTTTTALATSGDSKLLPGAKIALDIPIKPLWHLLIDTTFESLVTEEKLENGQTQDTTFTNFKTGIGIRRYF